MLKTKTKKILALSIMFSSLTTISINYSYADDKTEVKNSVSAIQNQTSSLPTISGKPARGHIGKILYKIFDNATGEIKNEFIQALASLGAGDINSLVAWNGSKLVTHLASGKLKLNNDLDINGNKIFGFISGDNLNMNLNKITNLAAPTSSTDAATKAYVDNAAGQWQKNGNDIENKNSGKVNVKNDLDVNGNIEFGTSGNEIKSAYSAGNSSAILYAKNSGKKLEFRANSNTYNQLVLDTNSKVGIGTHTPQEKLDINGNIIVENGNQIIFSNNSGTSKDFGIKASGENFSIVETEESNKEYFRINDDSSILLKPNGSTSMTLLSNGNIGIGTSPSQKLDVNGNIKTNGRAYFYNGSTQVGDIGTNDTSWLRINQNTAKNIYTPRMFRADNGFQVDGVQVIGGDAWVEGDRIRQNTIDGSEIEDNSLTASDLAANSVGSSELANNSVNSAKIQDNTVTYNDIADGTIRNQELANNSVNSAKVQDNSLTSSDLAANSVGNSELNNSQSFDMNYLHTNHGLNVNGRITLRSDGLNSDDSDLYYLEKIRNSYNNNYLKLQLNDDSNESFQIWGDSCGNGGCGGNGVMGHKFQANGDFYHRGNGEVHGTLNMTNHKITGLANPTSSSDAVTKSYVDNLVNGLTWKPPVNSSPSSTYGTCNSSKESWATYNKSDNIIYVCNGSSWVQMSSTVGLPNLAGEVTGPITSNTIANNVIDSANIKDNTVTSSDIQNNTITEADISDSFKARDADKLDGENSSRYTKSGNYGSYDFNNLTDASRVTSIYANAHSPFGNGRYTVYNARHRGGESDGYKRGSQIAIGMTSNENRIAFRNQHNGTWRNWTELQNRVSGSCSAGYSIRAIAANGSVTCEKDDLGADNLGNHIATQDLEMHNHNVNNANEISINDPGEGIIFGGNTDGNIEIKVKDDSHDNMLGITGPSSLKVGIGTTNPRAKLEVANSGDGFRMGQIRIHNTNEINNLDGNLYLQYRGGKNTILNYGGGNVGIGTASPSQQLHTTGTARFDGGVQVDGKQVISSNGGNHTANYGNNSHYGYFEVRRNDGKRGAFFGRGNGGDTVNLNLDNASTLSINKNLSVGGNLNIGEGKISDNSIVSADIKNNTITYNDIADGTIRNQELANNSVNSAKIQDNTVTSADIQNNTITEADISDSFKARDSDKLDGHDTSYFQRKISNSSCTYGIKKIDNNGTITCASNNDTDTQDLSISGHTLSLERGGSVTIPDNDTVLTKETVQDYIGEMVSGNTENGISVTYNDSANKFNFTVSETDPQVGSLKNGKWCTSNGTTINCTSDSPVSSLWSKSGNDISYNAGNVSTTKNLTVGGSITSGSFLYSSSDKRYKKNIKKIDSALEKINKLEGVEFTWKKDGKKSIGLIAQNVEKVFPTSVNTDKNGYKSVAYSSLVAPIIEAIKELTNKVDIILKQQEKIKTLENKVNSLEKRLEKLESKLK